MYIVHFTTISVTIIKLFLEWYLLKQYTINNHIIKYALNLILKF